MDNTKLKGRMSDKVQELQQSTGNQDITVTSAPETSLSPVESSYLALNNNALDIIRANLKSQPLTLDLFDEVTLKTAGNVMEIRYASNTTGSPIQKLDKDHGLDTRTGEVIDYQHNQNRAGDMASVAQSLKRLRDLINANLENPDTALWVTLTYAENMTDTKRLYKDFHAFWKRFLRYLKREGHPHAEYIAAAEPQGRGAWHLHCLFLFPDKTPFIPNADIAKLWGHGFTKTKSLKGVDNPGLYLTAYLGDMELTEALSSGIKRGRLVKVEVKGKQEKAIVKGARLKLYPPGFNLYRCSRGVKRPTICKVTEEEAQSLVGDAPLTYEKTVSVTDGAGEIQNVVNYRTYNRKKQAESSAEVTDKPEDCKG